MEDKNSKKDTENQIRSELKKEGVKKKQSWFKRKYIKLKNATKEFWVMGKYGFIMGGLAGTLLGTIYGTFEAYRMKSFLPIPLAICGSGFFFGMIFAISSVIRADGEIEGFCYQVCYIDEGRRMRYREFKSHGDFNAFSKMVDNGKLDYLV